LVLAHREREQRSDGGEPEYLAGAAVLSIPGFG
jgi:hypothetical protein